MIVATNVDIRIKIDDETKKNTIKRYGLTDKDVREIKIEGTLTDIEMSPEFAEFLG